MHRMVSGRGVSIHQLLSSSTPRPVPTVGGDLRDEGQLGHASDIN
jgi:hypothetical protein